MNEDNINNPSSEADVVAKVIIHMPGDPAISFECPLMFKLPEIGEILDINYENFLSKIEMEDVRTTLNNHAMVIDRIEGEHVYLRKGSPSI